MLNLKIKENVIDKIVRYWSPEAGLKRYLNKARFKVLSGRGYDSASKNRRQSSGLNATTADLDTILGEQNSTLRDRAEYLCRTDGYVAGVVGSTTTATVGAVGLTPYSQLNNQILKLPEKVVEEKQLIIEQEWSLFANTPDLDLARTNNYGSFCELAIRSPMIRGDVFFVFRSGKKTPDRPYAMSLQIVESDRVSNKDGKRDSKTLIQGIEKDSNGAPVRYHISNFHPGNLIRSVDRSWTTVEAFGPKSGRPNVLHLFNQLRPGQTRGVSLLAPLIEDMLMLKKYREIELMAAAVAGMFTVFIKTAGGKEIKPMEPVTDIGGRTSDKDYKIDGGAIVEMGQDDIVETETNPGRPNSQFGDFTDSILTSASASIEVPFEVFRQKFQSSFSASQAAIMQAWQAYKTKRDRLVRQFCMPLWREFFFEMVTSGRLQAPGFLRDPLIRSAYMGVEWVGPSQPSIKENETVRASRSRIEAGLSTHARETRSLTGGDFEKNVKRLKRENQLISESKVDEDQTNNQSSNNQSFNKNGK